MQVRYDLEWTLNKDFNKIKSQHDESYNQPTNLEDFRHNLEETTKIKSMIKGFQNKEKFMLGKFQKGARGFKKFFVMWKGSSI